MVQKRNSKVLNSRYFPIDSGSPNSTEKHNKLVAGVTIEDGAPITKSRLYLNTKLARQEFK